MPLKSNIIVVINDINGGFLCKVTLDAGRDRVEQIVKGGIVVLFLKNNNELHCHFYKEPLSSTYFDHIDIPEEQIIKQREIFIFR